MFDWRKAAPDRCYLCGLDGASGLEGDREHFISRTFFEGGKIPNEPGRLEPLPSHRVCNRSTSQDEQRVALAWATCRPLGLGSQERWDRAMRALKRPEAAGLRASFLENLEELPSGGAAMTVPHDATAWVLSKMAKGIAYQASGLVLGPELLWCVVPLTFDGLVNTTGETFDIPGGVIFAKYEVRSEEPSMCMALAIYGYHFFCVAAFPPGHRLDQSIAAPKRYRLAWPRERSSVAKTTR